MRFAAAELIEAGASNRKVTQMSANRWRRALAPTASRRWLSAVQDQSTPSPIARIGMPPYGYRIFGVNYPHA